MELTQETRYPAEDTTTIVLRPAGNVEFTVICDPGVDEANAIRLNGVGDTCTTRDLRTLHRWMARGRPARLTLPQDFRTGAHRRDASGNCAWP